MTAEPFTFVPGASAFAVWLAAAAWAVWIPATVLVTRRALAGTILPFPSRRRALAAAAAVALLFVAAAYLIPIRLDPSGVVVLCHYDHGWKGLAGRGLATLLWPFGRPPCWLAILGTRLFLLPGVLLAAAVVAPLLPPGDASGRGARAGTLLIPLLVLLATPHFVLGTASGFNFWFFGTVVLGLAAAFDDVRDRATTSGGLAAASGIVLLGLSRPEALVAALALAAGLLAASRGPRRARIRWMAAGALVAIGSLVPSGVAYLVQSAAHDATLVGTDANAGGTPFDAVLRMAGRMARHLPRDLAALASYHVLAVLAAWRLVRMARRRDARWGEAALAALLAVEFVAFLVHREGLVRFAKYGSLVAVPVWYLAVRTWLDRLGGRMPWMAVALALSATLSVGLLPDARPAEWVATRGRALADARRLARDLPAFARDLCGKDPDAAVLVALLDEEDGPIDASPGVAPAPREPDRWLVAPTLSYAGCGRIAVVRPPVAASAAALFASEDGPGPACAPRAFGGGDGAPRRATHLLVVHDRDDRPGQVRGALPAGAGCGWRIAREAPGLLLLEAVR